MKIKSGSIVSNPTKLLDGSATDHIEDRSSYLRSDELVTWTGTQIQFTQDIVLEIVNTVSGTATQHRILTASSPITLANGESVWALIDRTASNETLTFNKTTVTPIPAQTSGNKDVVIFFRRQDAASVGYLHIPLHKQVLQPGQTVRLGASGSGSGSGSGTGDDLDALQFLASFTDLFTESATNSNSSVNSSGTNAIFNAAKNMYALSYDASKTATGASTTITMSGAPAFTVLVGDVVVAGGVARKITAVASQTSYTIEAAFPTALSATACMVSQCVYTKDIYNLAVDGASLATEFGSATFSEVLVDYKDNATSGSNLFTPGTGPFISYVASPDNTSFTTVNTRPTLGTTTVQSAFLPSAGTSLYLRFFPNEASGSGTVNLITYKAFMQKSVSYGAAGGTINSAYAFLNGVGTPINCSVGLFGGKSTVTLNFSYAMGMLSGTTASSVKVFINGQRIPRFVDSTLTPDASFVEVSPTVIQLDKDYSSLNLSVEVIQDTQVLDSSTTNTSAIFALQNSLGAGTQSFVDQGASVPFIAVPNTTIVNRASIPNIAQDLKASFGIERIMTQSIYQLQNEFGPNGEPVWATPNDPNGLVRFAGGWSSTVDNVGQWAGSSSNADFVEITFYGTGLNCLSYVDASNRAFTYSVDGGSFVSGPYPSSSGSGVIGLRKYSPNIVMNIVSGLTLGIHTVKILCGSTQVVFYGFEVVNAASTSLINVNPGIAYNGGKKYLSTTAQTFAYNSVVAGTRGGRVVAYQNADGTIGQAWQAVNAAQANLTAADHTNEDIARTYSWREFGAGRSDDFSLLNSSATNVAFTLDDGTTTLTALNARIGSIFGIDGVNFGQSGTSDTLSFTFVGTGLDILFGSDGTSTGLTVTVDGSSIGTFSPAAANTIRNQKIVSGLPYGTHVVKFAVTNSTSNMVISRFTVYQPKKPAIALGAVELADYNVMASYVANSTQGTEYVGRGVIRKNAIRELTYVGSWSATLNPGSGTSGPVGGIYVNGATAGNIVKYTFFGAGFDLRLGLPGSTAGNYTLTIDGSTNLSGFTTSSYGGIGITPASGVVTAAATNSFSGGLSVSGLASGLHTITLSYNSGSAFIVEAMDIITPIHSTKSNLYADLQNTLPVGSQSIADSRKTSMIKESLSATKAWAQAMGAVSDPTTTSTSLVPMPDMSTVIKTGNGAVQIYFNGELNLNSAGNAIGGAIFLDGVRVGPQISVSFDTTSYYRELSLSTIVPVSAGVHKVDVYWSVSGGTATADSTKRILSVREI